MSISPFKTWLAGEILTASDLNSSFTQITNNGLSLISPLTGNLDLDGHDVIGDADGDSKLTFSTNNRMDVVLQGATLFKFDGTGTSPVNGIAWIAKATGTSPLIQAFGGDSNIGPTIADSNGNEILKSAPVASAVNEVTLVNAATGNAAQIQATGGDTDVSLNLVSKGAGTVQINGQAINAAALIFQAEVFA